MEQLVSKLKEYAKNKIEVTLLSTSTILVLACCPYFEYTLYSIIIAVWIISAILCLYAQRRISLKNIQIELQKLNDNYYATKNVTGIEQILTKAEEIFDNIDAKESKNEYGNYLFYITFIPNLGQPYSYPALLKTQIKSTFNSLENVILNKNVKTDLVFLKENLIQSNGSKSIFFDEFKLSDKDKKDAIEQTRTYYKSIEDTLNLTSAHEATKNVYFVETLPMQFIITNDEALIFFVDSDYLKQRDYISKFEALYTKDREIITLFKIYAEATLRKAQKDKLKPTNSTELT